MPKAVFYILALILFLGIPVAASANQLDLFGFNSRATSLANAYASLADGPEAAFYNPGALIESRNVRVLAGYSFSVPSLTLDVTERNGGDKSDPDEVRDARGAEAGQWLNLGVSGGIKDRVYFGLAMQLPVDGASRRKILSPDRPYFLDYDTGIFGMSLMPAMAVQLAPNFGLGAGARVTIDPWGQRWTDVPTAEGAYETNTLAESELSAQVSPIVGFYARSHEFLRFGLTYKGQSQSYFHKTDRQQLIPGDPNGFVEIEYEAWYNYIPRSVTVSIAGEPDEHVLITGEMSWQGWSTYKSPFPKVRLDFKAMSENDIDYARPNVLERPSADFDDVFVTRFGVEARVNKHLAFRLGYAFEPSPVPDQDGTTTIIDSATHVLAFGAGGNFGGKFGELVQIDFSVMDHIMTTVEYDKDADDMDENDPESNPAWPSAEARAHYIYSGMTATIHF
ncbi:MAG: outer membrane protein transport protein [Candidatus Lernaella stagnicola]|nr:outer membrane protein transport protein [Candidatus Lernaella stagnicola]